ncbi:hypothetical protein ACF0H5_021405 [Mactra antiquata]
MNSRTMAEGNLLFRSVEVSSDALFDKECTPCMSRSGSKQVAVDFCKTCHQSFCTFCSGYHKLYMKEHKVIHIACSSNTMDPLPVSEVPGIEKCIFHPDRDVEMYCGEHDMVYCSLCIENCHGICNGIKDIDQAANDNKSDLKRLLPDFTRINEQLQNMKKNRSSYLKRIKEKKDCILQEIKTIREKINAHFDKLERKVISELDEEINKTEEEINSDLSVIDRFIQSTETLKADITFDNNEKRRFVNEKIGQKILADAGTFLRLKQSLHNHVMMYKPNDVVSDLYEKLVHLGKVVCYKVTSLKGINNLKSDGKCFWIIDMCQLQDGTMLLIDYNNKHLMRLDDDYNVKDSMQFDSSPCGICCVSPTEVAVRLDDDTVQFISVSEQLSYQHEIILTDFRNVLGGMTYCNDQLWIPGDKAVYIYTLSGALDQLVDTDSNGQEIFTKGHPRQLTVSNDDTRIYVTAGDKIVVFNNEGSLISTFYDDKLDAAVGICCLDDASILVAGFNSGNIVMFNKYGNGISELLSRKDVLYRPLSLCYDKRKQCVVVGGETDNIRVFQVQ